MWLSLDRCHCICQSLQVWKTLVGGYGGRQVRIWLTRACNRRYHVCAVLFSKKNTKCTVYAHKIKNGGSYYRYMIVHVKCSQIQSNAKYCKVCPCNGQYRSGLIRQVLQLRWSSTKMWGSWRADAAYTNTITMTSLFTLPACHFLALKNDDRLATQWPPYPRISVQHSVAITKQRSWALPLMWTPNHERLQISSSKLTCCLDFNYMPARYLVL